MFLSNAKWFSSITPTEIWRRVTIFQVWAIEYLAGWPADRNRGWIGSRSLRRICWAGGYQAKTDRQWLAIRSVHRQGYLLFLMKEETHRNNDTQFTLFEFGHCITHVLEEEGAETGDTRATARMPSVRRRPRQTGEVVCGKAGRGSRSIRPTLRVIPEDNMGEQQLRESLSEKTFCLKTSGRVAAIGVIQHQTVVWVDRSG
jgi:hypothetical protein